MSEKQNFQGAIFRRTYNIITIKYRSLKFNPTQEIAEEYQGAGIMTKDYGLRIRTEGYG